MEPSFTPQMANPQPGTDYDDSHKSIPYWGRKNCKPLELDLTHIHTLILNFILRSAALTSGDLFLFKWVVNEVERDLKCRLEVYFGFPNQKFDQQIKTLAERKSALLQNSQLWRVFSVEF